MLLEEQKKTAGTMLGASCFDIVRMYKTPKEHRTLSKNTIFFEPGKPAGGRIPKEHNTCIKRKSCEPETTQDIYV